MKPRAFIFLALFFISMNSFAAADNFEIQAWTEPENTLSGTLWKIYSFATDDEYIGFDNESLYYVVGDEEYMSVYKLEDSFYKNYQKFSIGTGLIPEQYVNYPNDLFFIGAVMPSRGIGVGFALPLPVPALLILKEENWQPEM